MRHSPAFVFDRCDRWWRIGLVLHKKIVKIPGRSMTRSWALSVCLFSLHDGSSISQSLQRLTIYRGSLQVSALSDSLEDDECVDRST